MLAILFPLFISVSLNLIATMYIFCFIPPLNILCEHFSTPPLFHQYPNVEVEGALIWT